MTRQQPLIYVIGSYQKFREWCSDHDIFEHSDLVAHMGVDRHRMSGIIIPRVGAAIINLTDDDELSDYLESRRRADG